MIDWFGQETRGLPRWIERGLMYLLDENYLEQTPHGWVVKPEIAALPLAEKIGFSRKPIPHNLPLAASTFVGRERELIVLKQMLMRGRLLSLTGVGGAGKTRLMLQLAAQYLSGSADFYDGVFFVELAPLNDPQLLVQAVADGLGVREHRQLTLPEAIQRDLRDKRTLLLLDNCEHLLDAAAEFVGMILSSCPRIKIVVTSREALRVDGEQTFLVPSLSLPGATLPLALDELFDYEAIRLFVERAEIVNPAFRMTDANMSAVVQICRRLDGIPLALELAAAKLKSMSAQQVAERLDDRFRLLTGGSRTAFPRQQTLHALIEWSWQLLNASERILLRRLAVFANGWTLEAAESVCSGPVPSTDPSMEVPAQHPADVLSRLVDKSLVLAQEQDGAMRYSMLDTIRQYAREKLFAAQDALSTRTLHLNYFAQLAAQAEMHLRGDLQAVWIRRLETEHDNLRVALDWAFDRGTREHAIFRQGVQMANALWWFWFLRSHYSEGMNWLAHARTAHPADIDAVDRARAMSRSAYFAYFGKYALREAAELAERAAVLCEQVGEREGLALASGILGIFYHNAGDLPASWQAFERALQLMRELHNYWGTAFISELVGWFALHEGDYAAAHQYAQECLELRRVLRIPYGLMTIQSLVGTVAMLRGEYAAAAHAFETGLSMAQRMQIRINIANTKRNLANLALAQGQYDHAEPLYREAIAALNEPDGRDNRADVFFGLARIAIARGEPGQAQMLLEQALAMLVPDALQMDRFYAWLELANVRRLLGDVRLAQASYREALALLDRIPWNKRGVILGALGFAAYAASQNEFARAARLVAAAETIRTEIGMAWQADERQSYDGTLAVVRHHLDANAFARAWSAGAASQWDAVRDLMWQAVERLPADGENG